MFKKYKEYKLKLMAKYGQYFADFIIEMMSRSYSEYEVDYWFYLGLKLELMLYCYGIELE